MGRGHRAGIDVRKWPAWVPWAMRNFGFQALLDSLFNIWCRSRLTQRRRAVRGEGRGWKGIVFHNWGLEAQVDVRENSCAPFY